MDKTRRIVLGAIAGVLAISFAVYATVALKGANGNNINADANNNMNVVTPATIAAAGFVKLAGQDQLGLSTSGAFSGAPGTAAIMNRLKMGIDTLVMYDSFDGTNLNIATWQRSFNTTTYAFTVTAANGLLINSGAVSTANTNLAIFSPIAAQRTGTFPLLFRAIVRTPNQNITCGGGSCSGRADNAWAEIGLGTYATMTTSAVAAVTDGAFFRWTSTGLNAVAVFNGSEQTSALTLPDTNYHPMMVIRKATGADFYIDDVWVASIAKTASNPAIASTSRLNVFMRVLDNTASTSSAAPELAVGEVVELIEDHNTGKTWQAQLSGTGRNSAIDPTTSAATFLQTATMVNATAPTACTTSNTSLAANCPSGLGGAFLTTSGASATWTTYGDALINSYTVPAGFTLYVTKIHIATVVTTTIVTAAATGICWGVAVNSTAASLATADAAPTSGVAQVYGPRRLPLGCQSNAALTAGSELGDIDYPFDPPLVVYPGRLLQVFERNVFATWTAGAIAGQISFTGYFE